MNENTPETTMEESAPAGLGFSLPPDDTIRLTCRILSLFPWAESELSARMTPAFLAAALGGVKRSADTVRDLRSAVQLLDGLQLSQDQQDRLNRARALITQTIDRQEGEENDHGI